MLGKEKSPLPAEAERATCRSMAWPAEPAEGEGSSDLKQTRAAAGTCFHNDKTAANNHVINI